MADGSGRTHAGHPDGCMYRQCPILLNGRHDKALNDTASLCGIISQYEMEVGSYPSSLSDLTGKKGQYGPWIKELPKDPYKKDSNYQYQSQKDGFVVFSVGEDGSSSSSVGSGIKGDDIGYVSH